MYKKALFFRLICRSDLCGRPHCRMRMCREPIYRARSRFIELVTSALQSGTSTGKTDKCRGFDNAILGECKSRPTYTRDVLRLWQKRENLLSQSSQMTITIL